MQGVIRIVCRLDYKYSNILSIKKILSLKPKKRLLEIFLAFSEV